MVRKLSSDSQIVINLNVCVCSSEWRSWLAIDRSCALEVILLEAFITSAAGQPLISAVGKSSSMHAQP